MPRHLQSVWYLEKSGKAHFTWEIEVVGKETIVKAGKLGSTPKLLPSFVHRTPLIARKFAEKEILKKKKQGFVEVDQTDYNPDEYYPGGDPDDDPSNYDNPGSNDDPSNDAGNYDDPSNYDEAGSYDDPEHDNGYHANHSDHDTESVDSSASYHAKQNDPSMKWISPLNRRRSLRLAAKQGELMETETVPPLSLLTRQSTTSVIRQQLAGTCLQSDVQTVKRMDTTRAWSGWRQGEIPTLQKQETSRPGLKRRRSARGSLEDVMEEPEPSTSAKKPAVKKSKLLKKQSTTASLRAMLHSADLDDSDSEGVDEADGPCTTHTTSDTTNRTVSNTTTAKGRLKRKSTTVLSPIPEVSPKTLKSALRRNSTVVSPDTLKRQATANVTFVDDNQSDALKHKNKKLKTTGSLKRQGTVLRGGSVYIPPIHLWPVTMKAQVVWTVPLRSKDSIPTQGNALWVDPGRCLIADDSGTVIELDASVTPKREMTFPESVRCVLPDGEFTYVVCSDGKLYDISNAEPRCVFQALDVNKVTSMGVYNGLVAMGDDVGKLALLGYDGTAKWVTSGRAPYGNMVELDDTGVYHGHAAGVSKFSLMEGKLMWDSSLPHPVTKGVKTSTNLYVAANDSVFKLDKFSGKILKTYDKGKSWSGQLSSVCVGEGLVMAGGQDIVCYHESTGEVVYIIEHQFCPHAMQYYSGRLFCVGTGGVTVLDLTKDSVKQAQAGQILQPVVVTSHKVVSMTTPLKKVASVKRPLGANKDSLRGVVVQCTKAKARKGKLQVRALSVGFKKSWDVQLPMDLVKAGKKYLVSDLSPTSSGKFYRVTGDIKEVD